MDMVVCVFFALCRRVYPKRLGYRTGGCLYPQRRSPGKSKVAVKKGRRFLTVVVVGWFNRMDGFISSSTCTLLVVDSTLHVCVLTRDYVCSVRSYVHTYLRLSS